jgi:hypothetical protein
LFGARVNRDELKRILTEAARQVLASPEVARGGASSASSPRGGIVLFTGSSAPSPDLPDLRSLSGSEGGAPRALLSHSFRQANPSIDRRALGGAEPIAAPPSERELQSWIVRAPWLIAPDLSDNSLAKAAAGIEDSLPTIALAAALRAGRSAILLECSAPGSPLVGLGRLERLRRLERAGARRACPKSLARVLEEAAREAAPRSTPANRSPGRAIITAEDVHRAARRSPRELRVPAGAVVTAHARDEAERLGVELRTEADR